jgi:hypothetical protein
LFSFWRLPSIQIVLLCIAVSALLQTIGPLFQLFSANVICRDSFLNTELKTWFFNCPSASNESREQQRMRRTVSFVSYFDDPFVVEPWLPVANEESENGELRSTKSEFITHF